MNVKTNRRQLFCWSKIKKNNNNDDNNAVFLSLVILNSEKANAQDFRQFSDEMNKCSEKIRRNKETQTMKEK